MPRDQADDARRMAFVKQIVDVFRHPATLSTATIIGAVIPVRDFRLVDVDRIEASLLLGGLLLLSA